jgi:hypothetical protein
MQPEHMSVQASLQPSVYCLVFGIAVCLEDAILLAKTLSSIHTSMAKYCMAVKEIQARRRLGSRNGGTRSPKRPSPDLSWFNSKLLIQTFE